MNYAEIINGIVINVINADADFIATQSEKTYILCTNGGIGYTYDEVNKVFIAPKPYPSWTLDNSFNWIAPTPYPTDGKLHVWDETKTVWVLAN